MTNPEIRQAGQVLAAIYQQATGLTVPAPLDLTGFISTATTALNLGLDKIHNALWNMVGQTIIAVRPYRGRFRDMDFDTTTWGIVDRKISYLSRLPQDNAAWSWPVTYDATQTPPSGDGEAVDMYRINKDKVVQTAYYGRHTFAYSRTRFQHQLETAFRGPEEFTQFMAGALTSLQNDRELWHEGTRAGVVINAIAALYDEAQPGRVIHLLSEYNTETGLNLTPQTVRQPTNFPDFARWIYAKMGDIKARMARANILYTTQFSTFPAGYGVLRHTDDDALRLKMSAGLLNRIKACVLSTTYNPDMLNLDDAEPVAYWQSPDNPERVQAKPAYTGGSGTEVTTESAVVVSNIVGIMYDRDFMGSTIVRSDVDTTPFNTRGKYWNDDYSDEVKTRLDMTEKAVLLLLD